VERVRVVTRVADVMALHSVDGDTWGPALPFHTAVVLHPSLNTAYLCAEPGDFTVSCYRSLLTCLETPVETICGRHLVPWERPHVRRPLNKELHGT
jgi:hypothetical protein